MKKYNYFSLIIVVLFVTCNNDTKNSELLEIPVDIGQNISLSLSEIADEITAIELELTDESLINPDYINRIVLCDNYVIIAEQKRIHVFGMDGKFVRSIGSTGQGPGEYMSIRTVAIDESNKRLFVYSSISRKLICYNLDGKLIKESFNDQQIGIVSDMNYLNGELYLVAEQTREDAKGALLHSAIYRMNDDFQITDSGAIRAKYGQLIYSPTFYGDHLLYGNSIVYSYYYEPVPPPNFIPDQANAILRDTLYRLEKNHLLPELKLKLKNNGIDGSGNQVINLKNIYRSSRYVFAVYYNFVESKYYHFCYDTKVRKGYNMQVGYTDDINKIENRVIIRPLHSNTEIFYYWHTHMNLDDFEEPNPTLYIGKLKK